MLPNGVSFGSVFRELPPALLPTSVRPGSGDVCVPPDFMWHRLAASSPSFVSRFWCCAGVGPDVQNLPVSQPASPRHTRGAQDGGHKGSPHRGHPKPPTKAREAATCKPNNVRGGEKKIE